MLPTHLLPKLTIVPLQLNILPRYLFIQNHKDNNPNSLLVHLYSFMTQLLHSSNLISLHCFTDLLCPGNLPLRAPCVLVLQLCLVLTPSPFFMENFKLQNTHNIFTSLPSDFHTHFIFFLNSILFVIQVSILY